MERNFKLVIGVIAVVSIVIGAYYVYDSSLNATSNNSSVRILNLFNDKAQMELEGNSGHILYYLGVNLTYGHSVPMTVNASNFFVVTSNGNYSSYSPAKSPSGLGPLTSGRLTNGETTQGELALEV